MEKDILDISWGTIFKIFLAVILFFLLYQISDILVLFLFALIISILLSPTIDFLQRMKIPRQAAVLFVYLGVFAFLSAFIYFTIPTFASEIESFSRLIPEYFDKVSPYLEGVGVQAFQSLEDFLVAVEDSAEMIAENVFNALVVIFGGLFTAIFVITLAIFISMEGRSIEKAIDLLAPGEQRDRALEIWRRCRRQVSSWFLVRILSCIFVGLASYVTFYFFGIEYALLFALIAGILNIIPYIGPLVAGAIFFVVIVLDSTLKGVLALAAFAVIQTIESTALSPILSRKFMGISPVIVLMALVIGGALWGVLGAVLAIPLLGILVEFFKEYMERRKR